MKNWLFPFRGNACFSVSGKDVISGKLSFHMEIKRLSRQDIWIAEEIRNYINGSNAIDYDLAEGHLVEFLNNEVCYLFAAMDNNTFLGYALAYKFPSFSSYEHIAYLYDIEVLANFRGKRIGRQLIEHLIADLRKDQVKEIWLGTGIHNIPAQKLFSTTGGVKEAETFYEYYYYLD